MSEATCQHPLDLTALISVADIPTVEINPNDKCIILSG